MAKQEVLETNSVKESNEIVITETVQKRLTREDLLMVKMSLQRGLEQCDRKIEAINAEKQAIADKIVETDNYLTQLSE